MSGGSDATTRIIEEICRAKAKSVSVYADPEIVSGYDFWKTYQYSNIEDSIKDCWFWQIGYWIIEDVFSTVGDNECRFEQRVNVACKACGASRFCDAGCSFIALVPGGNVSGAAEIRNQAGGTVD